MPEQAIQTALHNQLFLDEAIAVYTILDGASVPNLLQMLAQHQPPSICLYRGELAPDLAAAAPYLVRLEPDTAFTEFVLEGFEQHWGIFLWTRASIRDLRKHFRSFLMVHEPKQGRLLYFRYYDPRVLRVYLPTCNAEDAASVFGPVERYFAEGEDSGVLMRFERADNVVHSESVQLI